MTIWRLLAGLLLVAQAGASQAQVILHVPFDGSVDAAEAAGPAKATVRGPVSFEPGKLGQAIRIAQGTVLTYSAEGNLNKVRGTICVWVRPDWDGDDGKNHAILSDVANFQDKSLDTLYFWKWSVGVLRLDLREPNDAYITAPVRSWRAGEWHHVAAAWDVREGKRLYIDGELVASRECAWEARPWPELHVGSDWQGGASLDGLVDDLRIYDIVLKSGHIRRVMAGKPLEVATVTRVEAPKEVRPGEALVVHAEARVPARLREDYQVDLHVGPAEVALTKPYRPTTRWLPDRENILAVATVIPDDLYLPPGKYPLIVRVHGTLPERGRKEASAEIMVLPPRTRASQREWSLGARGQVLRDGAPMLKGDRGLLWAGRYLGDDADGREQAMRLWRSGQIRDALPVRLMDEVDCATESHEFREWGESRVIEIGELGRFRVTAPPDSVTEKVTAHKREVTTLPAFSYRLRTSGRNRPHILVAELPNDRERYAEIAIDVADGSRPGKHLMGSGFGGTRLINLGVIYTGREYPCDGGVIRAALLFFPKSDEVEVTISSSGREEERTDTSGAAVSRLTLYEMTDALRNAWNEIPETVGPKRTVSLFYPNVPYVYTQYGFSGATREQRLASFRAMCHYLKFVGINRFEFYPLGFGMHAYYRGGMLEDKREYDVFEDLLPVADEEGVELMPVVPGLAFYDEFPEWNEPEPCFQLDIDGKSVRKFFGRVPDPLRPQVQEKLLGFLTEFLDRCEGHPSVRSVAFKVNGKIGTCYVGTAEDDPPEEAGYAEWDIRQFEEATGVHVGGEAGDAGSRYRWLRDNAWEEWINWRCEGTWDLWLKARDLARSRGKDLVVKTILPCNHPGRFKRWWDKGQTPFDILRGHGYDWRMYEDERGLTIQQCMLVDSDRYFGQWQNKAYAYDPRLIPGYHTGEGTATELYFVYWELPNHPKGFRVGPGSPPGRAYFEPMTYAIRTANTYNITLYNWYRATMFHEQDLREFCRAFRALPAAPPRDFEGEIEPADDPRVWVKWFGDRLCVLNDGSAAQTVRLTWPRGLKKGEAVFDVGRGIVVARERKPRRGGFSVKLELDAWDLRTLEVRARGR